MMRTGIGPFRTAKDNEYLKWLPTLTSHATCNLSQYVVKEYNKQSGTCILFYSNQGCLRA